MIVYILVIKTHNGYVPLVKKPNVLLSNVESESVSYPTYASMGGLLYVFYFGLFVRPDACALMLAL